MENNKISVIERHGSDENLAKLYTKLAKASKELINVPKNGYNKYYDYNYARADDIYLLVTDVLEDKNIMLLTSTVSKDANRYTDNKGNVVNDLYIEKEFSFNCGDTGAHVTMRYTGYDRSKDAKTLYKAYTGAMKYFLRDNFMIDTGDPDPEIDSNTMDSSYTPQNNSKKNNSKKKSSKKNNSNSKSNKKNNSSKKPEKKVETSPDKKEPNKKEIRNLFKDAEHKDLVRETILEYLKDMGHEPNLKEINNIEDQALDVLLVEIQERIKEEEANKKSA